MDGLMRGWYWYRWKIEDEWVCVWIGIHEMVNPGVYIPIPYPTGSEADLREVR